MSFVKAHSNGKKFYLNDFYVEGQLQTPIPCELHYFARNKCLKVRLIISQRSLDLRIQNSKAVQKISQYGALKMIDIWNQPYPDSELLCNNHKRQFEPLLASHRIFVQEYVGQQLVWQYFNFGRQMKLNILRQLLEEINLLHKHQYYLLTIGKQTIFIDESNNFAPRFDPIHIQSGLEQFVFPTNIIKNFKSTQQNIDGRKYDYFCLAQLIYEMFSNELDLSLKDLIFQLLAYKIDLSDLLLHPVFNQQQTITDFKRKLHYTDQNIYDEFQLVGEVCQSFQMRGCDLSDIEIIEKSEV